MWKYLNELIYWVIYHMQMLSVNEMNLISLQCVLMATKRLVINIIM